MKKVKKNNYFNQKSNRLEKLANGMLKIDERNNKLKEKTISKKFLNLF